jgi:hypothetical protein
VHLLTPWCVQNIQAEMGLLREKAEADRMQARAALAKVAQASEENRRLREAKPGAVALLESSCAPTPPPCMRRHAAAHHASAHRRVLCREKKAARLKAAEKEINALKNAIREVAFAALTAASGGDEARQQVENGLPDEQPAALLEVPVATNGAGPSAVDTAGHVEQPRPPQAAADIGAPFQNAGPAVPEGPQNGSNGAHANGSNGGVGGNSSQ